MKKVLVTGGAGFVGSNLVKLLKEEHPDTEIMVLDNYFTGSKENHVEGVTYINGNTWEINVLTSTVMFDPDVVFHFGEYSRIVTSFKDMDKIIQSNLRGTSEVLEYCRIHGAKLIYSASSSKFGNDGEDENLSPYAWSKAKMVELIKNYNEWFDLQYEICYFFNVYGEGQIMEGDYATVVGIFETQHKNGEFLTVVEPGTQTRDFTYIGDIVNGVLKTVDMNMNREWILRSGTSHTIIDVADMFGGGIKLLPPRKGERFTSEVFDDDTEEVLNWKPEQSLVEWIEQIKEI